MLPTLLRDRQKLPFRFRGKNLISNYLRSTATQTLLIMIRAVISYCSSVCISLDATSSGFCVAYMSVLHLLARGTRSSPKPPVTRFPEIIRQFVVPYYKLSFSFASKEFKKKWILTRQLLTSSTTNANDFNALPQNAKTNFIRYRLHQEKNFK